MSEHLPECLLPDFDKGVWVCCCAQLRACEARVLDAARDAVDGITDIAPVVNYGFEGDPKPYPLEGGCYECRGEQYGAAAALEAALDAIDALRHGDN